jgi:EamA domain-containing membrane protein RarD
MKQDTLIPLLLLMLALTLLVSSIIGWVDRMNPELVMLLASLVLFGAWAVIGYCWVLHCARGDS